MDKTKAIVFSVIQASEISEGHGKGYTLAGLESMWAKMSETELQLAANLARDFQEELERHGFAVGTKETMQITLLPSKSEGE